MYDNVNPLASKQVNVRRSYLFHTVSGYALNLNNYIVSNIIGDTQWTGSANINTALVYIDVLTPGAFITSAGGVNYASSNLIAVPDVVGDSEGTAENALASAGLSTGAIRTKHSATVPAGDVIAQAPAANANVVSGMPVNLVISAGKAK